MHKLDAFSRGNVHASPLAALVAGFRARVDHALPGMYAWFGNESLHVTLRALES